MKKKEMASLRSKTVKDLMKILEDKKKNLSEILVKIKMSQEKNLKAHRNLRLEIAQILTILKEKMIFEKENKKEVKA